MRSWSHGFLHRRILQQVSLEVPEGRSPKGRRKDGHPRVVLAVAGVGDAAAAPAVAARHHPPLGFASRQVLLVVVLCGTTRWPASARTRYVHEMQH